MSLPDSSQSLTERNSSLPALATQEEIVTPIEAEIQARVETDFEKPLPGKKAIISVNGEDVAELPAPTHDRAA